MSLQGSRLRILESGSHEVSLLGVDGREVFRATGNTGAEYALERPAGAQGGVYMLRVRTDRGMFSRSLTLF
jgi:hypothetical protein